MTGLDRTNSSLSFCHGYQQLLYFNNKNIFTHCDCECPIHGSLDFLTTMLNPLTAGTDYIRILHFLLAYCISAFKQVEDIK